MLENKQKFETDIGINDKSQGTVARHLRYCGVFNFQWQLTANSLLSLLMEEF